MALSGPAALFGMEKPDRVRDRNDFLPLAEKDPAAIDAFIYLYRLDNTTSSTIVYIVIGRIIP